MADEKAPEEHQILMPIPATTPPPNPVLRFLKNLPKDELKKLVAEYHQSPDELDQLIGAHRKTYLTFYWDYVFANYGSCLLYVYFPVTVASAGMTSFVGEFDSDVVVPPIVDYVFNWPVAIIYVIYDMTFFSVTNEALKSTLFVIHQKPYRQQLQEMQAYLRVAPRAATRDVATFVMHQSLLLPCNLTGVMSELVLLPLDYTQPYNQAFVAAVLFFGNEYFRKYTNVEYYEGVDFFFGPQQRPWIYRDRSYNTLIMTLFRWAGSVGLGVYPLYYYLAVESEQALGLWFPAYYIAAAKSIQSTFVLYPSAYNDYMEDYEVALAYFRETPELVALRQTVSAEQFEKLVRERRLTHLQECRDEIGQLHGAFMLYFFRQAYADFLLALFRAGMGLYFGYGIAELLWDDMPAVAADIIFMTLSVLLIGQIAYFAESDRFMDRYQARKLVPREAEVRQNTDWLADFLNVIGNWISGMQTLGALQALTDNGSPQLTTMVTLLVLEKMLNSIHFNRARVRKTVKANYEEMPSVREYCGRFFQRGVVVSEEKRTEVSSPAGGRGLG